MQNTNYLQFNMAANSPQEDREDSHSKRAHSPHNLMGKSTVGTGMLVLTVSLLLGPCT